MKILMDTTDIEKLLTTYCPQNVRYSGDKLLICFGEAEFMLGRTRLSLKTEVEYKDLTADLNCHLTDNGAEITVELK